MNIKTYQSIQSLSTGSTTYTNDLVELLGIDKSLSIDNVEKEIAIKMAFHEHNINKRSKIAIGKKVYKIEKDLLELSFEQFSRLESLLAEGDNINNLHKLLAIYVRPVTLFGKIRKFNIKEQEKISNELLEMDMSWAQSLMLFFFQLRSEIYEKYEHILFESGKNEYDGVYKEQINKIEKFFGWDFICKSLSNDNILNYYTIQKMSLDDVLDYLVVCKQENQVNEWKNSKNTIAI